MASGNTSFTKLITTTLQNLPSEVFDAVSVNDALFYMLSKRGNLKIVSGGRQFTHPIWYTPNTSFKTYSKTETIDTPLMDDLTRAVYDIKIVAGSVVISLLEEAMNSGNKEKLIDLVEETVIRARKSMAKVMGEQCWKDGSADKDFGGLPYLISDAPSGQTTVGGITSASPNTYWRNYAYTTSITNFDSASAGLTGMNTVLNNTTFGKEGPRLVVTTKTVYGLYEIALTANMRYVTTELADAGFVHLAYTTMPVVPDDNCPANHMYFVDVDSLYLQVLARGNMELTDMQPSHDQLLRVALLYLFGNLTTGSRRTQGVLTSITG